MGIVHHPNVVTDGLVACWDAANRKSYPGAGTVWSDLAGGNDGALVNGPAFSSDNLGSISFDGSDDMCQAGSGLIYPDNTSIEMWVSVGAVGSKFYVFVTNRDDDDLKTTIALYGDNRRLVRTWNPSGSDYMVAMAGVAKSDGSASYFAYSDELFGTTDGDNTIHQIVATFDSGTNELKFYYDGELKDTTTTSGSAYSSPSYWRFGSEYDEASTSYDLVGNIYSARLYSKTLSAEDVLQNYNATKRRFIGTESDSLVSRYDAADKRSYPSPSSYGIARWEDIQSFNYYGTLTNGAALAADKRSIAFDGTDDYVAVGEYVAQNLSELSVAVWVKPAAGNALYDGVCGRTGASSWATGWGLSYHDSNTFHFFGGHYSNNNALTDFTANEWNFVVGTVSSSAVQLYVNGVSGTTSAPGTVAMTSTNFLIGAVSSSYEGEQDIASLILYNRALTADEVVAMYHREKKHYL